MKKVTMLLMAAMLSGSAAIAQDSSMQNNKMNHTGHMKMLKNCVMMEGGKMMVTKNGKTAAMDTDMTMTNGTTVATDGTVKMKDGTTKQLKDGDCVYMDGKMKTGMKKDSMAKKPL